MTSGSTPIALAAASVAMTKAGNELEAPTATASPRLTPASSRRETIRPAKSGFVVVRFAAWFPSEVVMGEVSTPDEPGPVRVGRLVERNAFLRPAVPDRVFGPRHEPRRRRHLPPEANSHRRRRNSGPG